MSDINTTTTTITTEAATAAAVGEKAEETDMILTPPPTVDAEGWRDLLAAIVVFERLDVEFLSTIIERVRRTEKTVPQHFVFHIDPHTYHRPSGGEDPAALRDEIVALARTLAPMNLPCGWRMPTTLAYEALCLQNPGKNKRHGEVAESITAFENELSSLRAAREHIVQQWRSLPADVRATYQRWHEYETSGHAGPPVSKKERKTINSAISIMDKLEAKVAAMSTISEQQIALINELRDITNEGARNLANLFFVDGVDQHTHHANTEAAFQSKYPLEAFTFLGDCASNDRVVITVEYTSEVDIRESDPRNFFRDARDARRTTVNLLEQNLRTLSAACEESPGTDPEAILLELRAKAAENKNGYHADLQLHRTRFHVTIPFDAVDKFFASVRELGFAQALRDANHAPTQDPLLAASLGKNTLQGLANVVEESIEKVATDAAAKEEEAQ